MSTSQKNPKLEGLLNKESGRIVIIPMDDGLLDGAVGGLQDMPKKVKEIVEGGADAILGFLGVYKQCKETIKDRKFILNVTASTKYSMNPQKKVQIYAVEQAKELGVSGIAVHINIGSVHLDEQLEICGNVATGCMKYDLPLLAIAYPRGEMVREDCLVEATAYAARVAAEIGADMVKTKYLGKEAFKEVLKGCPIPVIMAGGKREEQQPTRAILEKVHDCIHIGGAGVAIGRNAFHHEDTTRFVKALGDIVHHSMTVGEAIEKYMLKN